MRLALAAALVFALATAAPALAKDKAEFLGGFDKFDTDKNGSITLVETKAFYKAKKKAKRLKKAPEIFANWDKNDDGKVTKAEYAAYAESKAGEGGKKKKKPAKPAKDKDKDDEGDNE